MFSPENMMHGVSARTPAVGGESLREMSEFRFDFTQFFVPTQRYGGLRVILFGFPETHVDGGTDRLWCAVFSIVYGAVRCAERLVWPRGRLRLDSARRILV